MECNKSTAIVSTIILSIGIIISGFFISKAVFYAKIFNRSVTVKGLAERDVKSDLGIWEIDYREIGDNLTTLNDRIQHDQTVVSAFLQKHGFQNNEMAVQPIKVEDRLANVYSQQSATPTNNQRYIVTGGIRIRSNQVDSIQQTSQLTGSLLQQGVSITFDMGVINPNPTFYFTNLDSLRPSMLAEATKSARLVAMQFAKDAHTHLGGIQHASQGLFQIMGRDSSTMSSDWNSNQSALGSIDKKVRLVTTIDYRLK